MALFPLMPDGENDGPVMFGIVTIQGEVTTAPTGNHQFPETFLDYPPDERVPCRHDKPIQKYVAGSLSGRSSRKSASRLISRNARGANTRRVMAYSLTGFGAWEDRPASRSRRWLKTSSAS